MLNQSQHQQSRFVCPDDRQLALRAKLKTGWSVKTGLSGQSTLSSAIAGDEQQIILDVIRRAEKVDRHEQERIGRLVDRLENMRRNALGKNPTQCLICGENFSILGPQKVCCVDCKMLVCQKCSIEIDQTTEKFSKDQWVCMICVESREIWKKSGAWFFKVLPKYVTPTGSDCHGLTMNRPGRGGSRRSRSGTNTSNQVIEEDSSSDEERRLWKAIAERRKMKTDSIQDLATVKAQQVSTLSKEYEPLIRNYMASSSANLDSARSVHSMVWDDNEQQSITTGDASSETSRRESVASRSVQDLYWTLDGSGSTTMRGSQEKLLVSPCGSVASNQLFRNGWNNGDSVGHSSYNEANLGTVELSLTYDPITSTLHCAVYRAKNLIAMDINGLADPFCKLNILPNPKVSLRLRTKTVHKTRNPEFNENLTFYDITDTDLATKCLCLLVVDDDRYGHDYMGEIRVSMAKLKSQNTIYYTLALQMLKPEQKEPCAQPETNEWFDDLWLRGQIWLSLSYNTKRRALLVTVLKCTNLLPMDNNGYSDPFVKMHLVPDPYHRKYKTSTKWKNLNPVYNEEFAFETRPTELSTQSLYITVWDKDYGKSNDYLGGLILGGVGSKGQRLKHWLDMIKYPDHKHVYWHNLTEEPLH